MKIIRTTIVISICIISFSLDYAQKEREKSNDFPVLKGPYLGQNPPGMIPEVFAPGFISTENTEHGTITFSPERDEVFWAVIYTEPFRKKILYSKLVDGKWTLPKIAPFSLGVNEGNPIFSPDGTKLFFTSWKSLTENGNQKHYIMFSRKTDHGWSKPELIDDVINSICKFWHHSVSSNGNFYFMDGGDGAEIFCSKYKNGHYQNPQRIELGFPASTPFIANDESYIIFSASDRPDGCGEIDLYISYKKKDGTWIKGKNLGEKINSIAIDIWPIVSPDGKYLFFTSSRNENMDIYWVGAGFIQALKPENLN